MNRQFRYTLCAIAGMTISSAVLAADAAEKRPVTTVTKNCDSATGQTKLECEKVARQIAADPAGKHSSNATMDTDKITHSSPVMQTEEERAAEEALKKGKDPKKAIEKVKDQDSKPAN